MLGDKILSLRKNNKWTQEQLSKKLKIKQPQLNRWETGKAIPTIDGLKKLSKIFDISIDTLVFDDNDLKSLKPKDKALVSQLKNFDQLKDQQKQAILNLIDTFLNQNGN